MTKTAITHSGPAHRDDFLLACVLLSKGYTVHRKNEVSQSDLDCTETVVFDVGGDFDPQKNNYDHHQDNDPSVEGFCALSLYLTSEYGDVVYDVFGWLKNTEKLDNEGPAKTAQSMGLTVPQFFSMGSPIEAHLLRMFSQLSEVHNHTDLGKIMSEIGKELDEQSEWGEGLIEELQKEESTITIEGVRFHDLRSFKPSPLLNRLANLSADKLGVVGSVSYDQRGEGVQLFRYNDHPSLDFSKLDGQDEVLFAHKGGFIVKTKDRSSDLNRLIRLAKCSKGE